MAKSTLLAGYSTSQMIIMTNLDGISHDESMMLPEGGGNSINWVAGHILASRTSILKLLGEDRFLSLEDQVPYARGAERLKPGDTCVSMERIREGLEKTGKAVLRKLRGTPDSTLAQDIEIPDFPIKFDEPTLDAHLSMLLYHEGYHTGQLGLGRCVIGKAPRIK
jgi:DinB superfamily